MGDDVQFLTSEQMARRYGDWYAGLEKVALNPAHVPAALRPLIPYAALWGVNDDDIWMERIDTAPLEALEDLQRAYLSLSDVVNDWLGTDDQSWFDGPAKHEGLSFSVLSMAQISAGSRLDRETGDAMGRRSGE